jgi:fatty acid desaturase
MSGRELQPASSEEGHAGVVMKSASEPLTHMSASGKAAAVGPAVVEIAHRAALLYSFALLLVATFVELSGWGTAVNLVAAGAMTFYFFAVVVGYALHGWRRDTDNQFRDPVRATHPFMVSLIVAEIGGWIVLIAGFLDGQVF